MASPQPATANHCPRRAAQTHPPHLLCAAPRLRPDSFGAEHRLHTQLPLLVHSDCPVGFSFPGRSSVVDAVAESRLYVYDFTSCRTSPTHPAAKIISKECAQQYRTSFVSNYIVPFVQEYSGVK